MNSPNARAEEEQESSVPEKVKEATFLYTFEELTDIVLTNVMELIDYQEVSSSSNHSGTRDDRAARQKSKRRCSNKSRSRIRKKTDDAKEPAIEIQTRKSCP